MSSSTEALTAEALRARLQCRLVALHCKEPDTVLSNELGICQGNARIDLVAVNGQLHGYEIKSDRDSLRRLGTQAAMYGKVFDRVTLVCGERHLTSALEIIPAWWGVLRIASTAQDAEV